VFELCRTTNPFLIYTRYIDINARGIMGVWRYTVRRRPTFVLY